MKSINRAAGELTKVGQTLCEIEVETEGEQVEEVQAERAPVEEPTPVQAAKEELGEPAGVQAAEEVHELLNPIDTAMSSSGAGQFSGEAGILPSPASYAPPSEHETPHRVVERRGKDENPQRNKGLASPAVRTHAARLGIDLSTVKGTGPGGRILKEDLAQSGSTKSEEITRVAFGRSRKAMWKGMGKMGAVPHFG